MPASLRDCGTHTRASLRDCGTHTRASLRDCGTHVCASLRDCGVHARASLRDCGTHARASLRDCGTHTWASLRDGGIHARASLRDCGIGEFASLWDLRKERGKVVCWCCGDRTAHSFGAAGAICLIKNGQIFLLVFLKTVVMVVILERLVGPHFEATTICVFVTCALAWSDHLAY